MPLDETQLKFDTLAVHGGQTPDPATGSSATIHLHVDDADAVLAQAVALGTQAGAAPAEVALAPHRELQLAQPVAPQRARAARWVRPTQDLLAQDLLPSAASRAARPIRGDSTIPQTIPAAPVILPK